MTGFRASLLKAKLGSSCFSFNYRFRIIVGFLDRPEELVEFCRQWLISD